MTKSRMTTSRWTRHVGRAARGGALGLVVLAACAQVSARAQDDDDKNSIWNLDKRIFEGFAKGLGLQKGDAPGIDYRERSPLVVPPSRNLPPPEQAGTARAAEWPVDPDVKRREERTAKKKLDRRGYDEDAENRALLPSELDPPGSRGRTGSVSKPAKPGSDQGDPEGGNFLPSQLGYFGGLFSGQAFGFGGQKDEVGTFTKEPPRTTLTTPPTGYQTPSPAQPYGVSKSTGGRQTATPLDPAVGSLGN
jgi:hypothetical protein